MRLKLFRAASMAQAMGQVRSELGGEALILSSRRVADGVEVTAALEPDNDLSERASRRGDAPANPASRETDRPVPLRWPPPRRPAAGPGDPGMGDPGIGGESDRSRGSTDERRAEALAWHGVPEALARKIAAGPLPFALNTAFRFAPLDLSAFSPPLLLAGPPGAGKTLTAARLAARLVIGGARPLVITADGQRAGAAEQLAAFTRLLGLELLVACTPSALVHALGRRENGTPVLIDAPGIDPSNRAQADQIAALALAAGATSALVLPSGLDPAEAGDVAGAFRALGTSMLVANRLDVARRMGGILAAAQVGLAFTEAGIGPGAADGLVSMTPAFLAGRLLQFPDRHP